MTGSGSGKKTKRCSVCKETKAVHHFSFNKTTSDGRRCCCKKCTCLWNNEYYRLNKDSLKDRDRRRLYGMQLGQYEQLLSEQGGVCVICGLTETATMSKVDRRVRCLAVDHDHDSGCVRGLLCRRCNKAIGLLREDIDIFASAISYLLNVKVKERQIA